MEKEIDTIDGLFDRIDDELIILYEAKTKKSYKWFDFVAALQLLNDRLQNEGYNEYRTRKVSRLVNVFNDLCHTIVQSYSYRVLAYDKERKVATEEWHVFGEKSRVKNIERLVIDELEEYYESLSLPEQKLHSSDNLKMTKIKYLLSGCDEDSAELASIYSSDSDEMDNSLKSLKDEWGAVALNRDQLLSERRGDFNEIFKMDSNIIYQHKIDFERYVKELKAERNILGGSIKDSSTQTYPNAQSANFSVNKSYEEMQRILTELQQQGFISADTTIGTFYYRMTGNGEPVQGRICWVKRARNRAISLTSLIDFLVTIGIKLESALSMVDDVFCRVDGSNIALPNDTKTTARSNWWQSRDISEYHQTIMAIINDGQATK